MKIGFIGLGNVGGKLAGSLLRNKFNLTLEMVNYEPIPIIKIPEMGTLSAITACDEFKVQS